MFFIVELIKAINSNVYNIEIFLCNNLLIFVYFAIHYKGFIKIIRTYKADIIYKKYKGILIIHIALNCIISFVICIWLVSHICYKDHNYLWNILFAPFISATIATAFDSRILRAMENRIYKQLRAIEYENYRTSLEKLIEAQEIQQEILNIHNEELGELRKNINLVNDMMHSSEPDDENT